MLRSGAVALACVLIVACGGDDDADGATSASPAADEDPAGVDGTADQSEALADNAARDSMLDAVGSESDVDLDSAIASLSPETRYDIAAGQMDPEPAVEIDGTTIRLVFGGGSVADTFMSCILASAIQSADETVTLVYPDGEHEC